MNHTPQAQAPQARPECPHAAGEVAAGQQVTDAWDGSQWRSYAVLAGKDGALYRCHETNQLGAKLEASA